MNCNKTDEFKNFCDSYNGCYICPLGKDKAIYEMATQNCKKEFEKMKENGV